MRAKITLHFVLLAVIFLIAFSLRFYKLGTVPPGFYQDESAIGYNAYSIMQTGRDEYGVVNPLYFKSFGDYKLPVYIYSTILPIKIFGLNEFAVRFPSAFFGFLTVIAFYFFTKSLSENRNVALFATALLAINPWHLHYNRATFEVSIALFLFVLGGLLFYTFFNRKITGTFLLGSICFVIALYTYNLTRLLSPLLFLLFFFFFKKQAKQVQKSELMVAGVVVMLSLIPFVLTLFQSGGVSSSSGTTIFSSAFIQSQLLEFRSFLIDLPSIFVKILYNSYALTSWGYIENVFSYLSVSFFFISGSPHGNHGIGSVGQFYLFELITIITGIVVLFLQKARYAYFLLLWIIVVILVASLTREAPHATRSFFLLVPFAIFSSVGFLHILGWINRFRTPYLKVAILSGIFVFVSYNISYYIVSYYVRFPVFYAKDWRAQDKELSLFLKSNENQFDKVVFDKEAGFVYSSLLFHTHYPPSVFQQTVQRLPDDSEGMSEVSSFGKYTFKEINWEKDYPQQRTLYVTSPQRVPKGIAATKVFYYPKRPVVISVRQEILQYPVEDVAYVVIASE